MVSKISEEKRTLLEIMNNSEEVILNFLKPFCYLKKHLTYFYSIVKCLNQ